MRPLAGFAFTRHKYTPVTSTLSNSWMLLFTIRLQSASSHKGSHPVQPGNRTAQPLIMFIGRILFLLHITSTSSGVDSAASLLTSHPILQQVEVRWIPMSDVISEYVRWKQKGEALRAKARQAMEARFRDLLLEAVNIAEDYKADFGGTLKPPPRSPLSGTRRARRRRKERRRRRSPRSWLRKRSSRQRNPTPKLPACGGVWKPPGTSSSWPEPLANQHRTWKTKSTRSRTTCSNSATASSRERMPAGPGVEQGSRML